ncbi:MAG: alkaline phosphatase family protein, partial [Stenotrophobium sp.]
MLGGYRIAAGILLTLLAGCGSSAEMTLAGGGGPYTESSPPPIRHVFVIVLENKGFDETFTNNTQAPYLSKTLPAMGQLLRQYYGTGHLSLDNYIAMTSGQAPNALTSADCPVYLDFVGGVLPVLNPDGQALGAGCVYPAAVQNIADQLEQAKFSWKGYMEGIDDGTTHTCRHPALNSPDGTQAATAASQYASRHDPFVYFHSIIDNQARCDTHVVDLKSLPADLQSAATTPNYSFITPDLCSDGHDATCANPALPGGYAGINGFLQKWVPLILASPAYQQDGMLIVTFDESDYAPPNGDASACCGEMAGPSSPLPGITGMGGGRT